MAIKELPISLSFDRQRFLQYSPADCANHYAVTAPTGKKQKALYPVMGRKHLMKGNANALVFSNQPRKIFKSIGFVYIVVGATIYRVDQNFNKRVISDASFTQVNGDLNFAFLPTIQGTNATPRANTQATFCMFCDGDDIFIFNEATSEFSKVTDTLRPPFPLYCAAFVNRFVVSSRNSTQFQLTQINLGAPYDPLLVFTINGAAVFAQESGLIRQMAVLHNLLFIFTDYTTGIWSNTPRVFNTADASSTFPFKKNTSYEFDYGIADSDSLDVDFGMVVWLAQNRNGLVTFMSSNGQDLKPISSQAVNVVLQQLANVSSGNFLLNLDTTGFLYQYEDSVFYRANIGDYVNYDTLDRGSLAVSLEYNFNNDSWHRCIELNGERNRTEQHEFFANTHMTIVSNQTAIYNMSGEFYFNELQDSASPTGFQAYPFRYENVTSIISEPDYSEFITDYVQIDFVWGAGTASYSDGPYANTVFLVAEASTAAVPVYLVAEDGVSYIIKDGTNVHDLNSTIYNTLFNPHIELYFSDDGGVSFHSADVLEFSQLGVYQWRMRWYQCGASRNRVYKLICVSPAPIVILGGVFDARRVSGGAN